MEIREAVCRYPSDLIMKVAAHREGFITQAMWHIADGDWAMAQRAIKAEIARQTATKRQGGE